MDNEEKTNDLADAMKEAIVYESIPLSDKLMKLLEKVAMDKVNGYKKKGQKTLFE